MSKETNFVTHLECSLTGTKYEKNKIHGLSEGGKPLLVRYDLKKMGDVISRDEITESDEPGFWRYSFMLPVEKKENRISLGEVVTPLIKLDKILKNLSFNSTVLIKGKNGSGKVFMRSAPAGTGIIAGGPMRALFESLGIKDVVAKSTGTSNPHNMLKATLNAFKMSESPKSVAAKRSKKINEINNTKNS